MGGAGFIPRLNGHACGSSEELFYVGVGRFQVPAS